MNHAVSPKKLQPGLFSRLLERSQTYASLVKFEHTLFALPFALSAMLLATEPTTWPGGWTVLWILLAMVGGRTYAMALNRLIDAQIDAANPRTQGRDIPAGRVRHNEALMLALLAGFLMTVATFQLPVICQLLLPVAFAILTVYSFVKRFSSLAHLVLGVALGASAVGGWLAVTGEITMLPVLFGSAVVFWVAGFDVIYACQDVDFDRKYGLYSIPSVLGVPKALVLSRVFHALTILLMVTFALLHPWAGWGVGLATALMAILLIYEQRLVTPDNLSRVNEAFFVVNGWISVSVLVLVLVDKLLQGLN